MFTPRRSSKKQTKLSTKSISYPLFVKQFYFSIFYKFSLLDSAWKVSVFGVFQVLIFPHLDWIRGDTKRYSVSLPIQSECRKIRIRKTPNTDTFHEVQLNFVFHLHEDFHIFCNLAHSMKKILYLLENKFLYLLEMNLNFFKWKKFLYFSKENWFSETQTFFQSALSWIFFV